MEHKRITGGEHLLPFARSRIRALRATGMLYASQQFEIDGVSVKVRIEPGHEYITILGYSKTYMSVSRTTSSETRTYTSNGAEDYDLVYEEVIDQKTAYKLAIYRLPRNVKPNYSASPVLHGETMYENYTKRGKRAGVLHGYYYNKRTLSYISGTMGAWGHCYFRASNGSIVSTGARASTGELGDGAPYTAQEQYDISYNKNNRKYTLHVAPAEQSLWVYQQPYFIDSGNVSLVEFYYNGDEIFPKLLSGGEVSADLLYEPTIPPGRLPQRGEPYSVREVGPRLQGQDFIIYGDEVFRRDMTPFTPPRKAPPNGAPLSGDMFVIPNPLEGKNVFEIRKYPKRDGLGNITDSFPAERTIDISWAIKDGSQPTTEWVTVNALQDLMFSAATDTGPISLSFVEDRSALF